MSLLRIDYSCIYITGPSGRTNESATPECLLVWPGALPGLRSGFRSIADLRSFLASTGSGGKLPARLFFRGRCLVEARLCACVAGKPTMVWQTANNDSRWLAGAARPLHAAVERRFATSVEDIRPKAPHAVRFFHTSPVSFFAFPVTNERRFAARRHVLFPINHLQCSVLFPPSPIQA